MQKQIQTREDVQENALSFAIGVVSLCGPRLFNGRLPVNNRVQISTAFVSLFLQECDQFNNLRWLVDIDGLHWHVKVVVFNSYEQAIGGEPNRFTFPNGNIENLEYSSRDDYRESLMYAIDWFENNQHCELDWMNKLNDRRSFFSKLFDID